MKRFLVVPGLALILLFSFGCARGEEDAPPMPEEVLDAVEAVKGLRHNISRVMIAVSAQVFNRNLGVGYSFLNQPFNFRNIHGHGLAFLHIYI